MTRRLYEKREAVRMSFTVEISVARQFMRECHQRDYVASRVVQRLLEEQLRRWRNMKIQLVHEDTTYG